MGGGGGATGSRAARAAKVAATVGLWAVAIYLAQQQFGALIGFDLLPSIRAAHAMIHGHALYRGNPLFTYPPFAAVLFAPLAALSVHAATHIYSVVQVLVPAAGLVLLSRKLVPRHWPWVGALSVIVFVRSEVFAQSYFLENPTYLFVLPLAVAAVLFATGRWEWGAAVVGASIAVKPLLVLVLLVPLIRGKHRALGIGVAAAALLTAIGAALSHDLSGLVHLPRRVLSGTTLHGALQVNNVSLASVGIVHHVAWLTWIVRAVLVAATALVVWRSRREPPAMARMLFVVSALVLIVAVCGSIDENHYGLLALPACLGLALGFGGRLAQVLGVIAALMLCVPLYKFHVTLNASHVQLRWALAHTLTLVACLVAASSPTGERGRYLSFRRRSLRA